MLLRVPSICFFDSLVVFREANLDQGPELSHHHSSSPLIRWEMLCLWWEILVATHPVPTLILGVILTVFISLLSHLYQGERKGEGKFHSLQMYVLGMHIVFSVQKDVTFLRKNNEW